MTKGPTKGSFGDAGLPVATHYVYPSSRNRAVWIGVALGTLGGLVLAVNLGFGAGDLVANGPLSSAHAMLEDNCAACHTSFEAVSSDKCSVCHERLTDTLGAYTFNAHYVYVSRDRTRAFGREHEVACAACHVEHGGRRADLRSTVTAARCESCHATGSFDRGHPEFDFVTAAIPDDAGLTFTHIAHVDRVLDDRNDVDPEVACLVCHVPTLDARGFQPIAFDACRDCHLQPDLESAELPIQPDGVPIVSVENDGAPLTLGVDADRVELTLGVETLATVRARLGPGEQWSRRMSAVQFDVDDGIVVKTAIAHADPWVLHNLRRLRRAIYPSGGLADLLDVSADVASADTPELYAEALETLRMQADGLRGRDEDWVQAALLEIDQMAGLLERRASDPNTTLNDARFRVAARDPRLTDAQLDEIDGFAADVAEPCLKCHAVERATIARVRPAQQVLRRARFDHRAHVIQRGCLDCHTRIPFGDYLGDEGPIDAALDNATIQNVPAIDECRQCHLPDRASTECVTCHVFHPDRSARSRLLP